MTEQKFLIEKNIAAVMIQLLMELIYTVFAVIKL